MLSDSNWVQTRSKEHQPLWKCHVENVLFKLWLIGVFSGKNWCRDVYGSRHSVSSSTRLLIASFQNTVVKLHLLILSFPRTECLCKPQWSSSKQSVVFVKCFCQVTNLCLFHGRVILVLLDLAELLDHKVLRYVSKMSVGLKRTMSQRLAVEENHFYCNWVNSWSCKSLFEFSGLTRLARRARPQRRNGIFGKSTVLYNNVKSKLSKTIVRKVVWSPTSEGFIPFSMYRTRENEDLHEN